MTEAGAKKDAKLTALQEQFDAVTLGKAKATKELVDDLQTSLTKKRAAHIQLDEQVNHLKLELKQQSEAHKEREHELTTELKRLSHWLESKTEQQYELERDILCLSGELNRHDEDADEKLRHVQARCQTLTQVVFGIMPHSESPIKI